MAHTAITRYVDRSDSVFLRLNLALLLVVSFLLGLLDPPVAVLPVRLLGGVLLLAGLIALFVVRRDAPREAAA